MEDAGMHGFHASEQKCSYGWAMFPVCWTLAGAFLAVALLI
jgi:hypothetical protein